MLEPGGSPLEWLSSRTIPRIDRERLPFGRPLKEASFEWLDSARGLLGRAGPFPARPPEATAAFAQAAGLVLGPYIIVQIGQRLELHSGSAVRWAVDAAGFGGTPQVTLQTAPGAAVIALAGAYYPGTTIPADLTARIFQSQGTWRIRIRLRFGAFDATLDLPPWLDRTTPAVSLVALDLSCCPLGEASELRADGAGAAGFTPDWVLGVFGPNVLAFDGLADAVTADAAVIVPIPAGSPSLLLPQTLRRTAIVFFSDTQFPLVPELSEPWPRFHRGEFRFDGLALEAGLDTADTATRILFAQSSDDPERLAFEPAGGLRGSNGEPFRLPVSNPRYAVLFDHARERRAMALVAQVDEKPQWMHGPGCSLVVSRSSMEPALLVFELPPADAFVTCRTIALSTAFHVPGMLVRPSQAPARMELAFSWGAPSTPLPPRAGHVEIDSATGAAVLRLPRDLTLDVVRRDDLLVLGYGFDNLRFEGTAASRVFFRGDATEKPFLIVQLPPQSVGEEAFFEAAAGYDPKEAVAPGDPVLPQPTAPPPTTPDAPPVKALLAQPSRLVFQVPDGVSPFDLSSPRLLTWTDLPPALAATALPGQVILVRPNHPDLLLPAHDIVSHFSTARLLRGQTRPAVRGVPSIVRAASRNVRPLERIRLPLELLLRPMRPGPRTTAIEAPFRLLISPNKYGGWKHALAPVAHDGRIELWHTRLGILSGGGVDEEQTQHRHVRAIWARDFGLTIPEGRPFLMSLSQDDRRILVHLTSDFSISPPPVPVGVNRLMLTALGAWMDTEVKFEPPAQLPIEEWQHRATLGRDQFAKVVYPGHLYCLGNRASVVKITERRVQPTPLGDPAAYLRQRMFIIVREPERTYTGAGYAKGGREFPFKRVRILTKVTPNLDPPQIHPLGVVPFAPAPLAKFWPHVLGQPFRFHVKAWDWEDREIDFTIPLAFVRTDQTATPAGAPDDNKLNTVVQQYNAAPESLRASALGGQGVAFAETDAASHGKTRLETDRILLQALAPVPARSNAKATPVHPQLERAAVSIPALRQVAGSAGAATITLEPYITLGFAGGNPAKLFAGVSGASLDYAGKADKAGGVVTPSLQVRGLARELGAVGDDGPQMRSGTFDPAAFFGGADPKLLGGISLLEIIESATGADFLKKTPKLVTENRDDFIRTTVDWTTDRLKDAANGFRAGLSSGGPPSTLALSSVLLTRKDTGASDFTLSGELANFRLSLFDVIEVAFKVFRFKSENGRKPEFHVELQGTGFRFLGNLEFVNELVKVLDTASFTDPPFLDISPQGLALGYTLTIPSVAVGVVGLSNIALGARLALPFTGEPARLRFNLSERHNPFIVSVAPFGGGGFFAIAVGVDGLEVLEASLEFGGNVSIDLGVASGGVYVMAGIYFRIKMSAPESSELTGYVRLGGSLSVLGIITVSIEFYLGLSYEAGKAWGEARVTVTIDVLLFSGDVTVRCRREFSGSSGDPPFRKLMPHDRWKAYAAAFA